MDVTVPETCGDNLTGAVDPRGVLRHSAVIAASHIEDLVVAYDDRSVLDNALAWRRIHARPSQYEHPLGWHGLSQCYRREHSGHDGDEESLVVNAQGCGLQAGRRLWGRIRS